MKEIPVSRVQEFQTEFLSRMRMMHRADALEPLAAGRIDADIQRIIESVAAEVIQRIKVKEDVEQNG